MSNYQLRSVYLINIRVELFSQCMSILWRSHTELGLPVLEHKYANCFHSQILRFLGNIQINHGSTVYVWQAEHANLLIFCVINFVTGLNLLWSLCVLMCCSFCSYIRKYFVVIGWEQANLLLICTTTQINARVLGILEAVDIVTCFPRFL